VDEDAAKRLMAQAPTALIELVVVSYAAMFGNRRNDERVVEEKFIALISTAQQH